VGEVLVYRRTLSSAEVVAISKLENDSLILRKTAGAAETGTCHFSSSK